MKKLLLSAMLAMLAVTCAAIKPAGTRPSAIAEAAPVTFSALLDEAEKAEKSGDWRSAEDAYAIILERYPDHDSAPMLLNNMGLMQSYQGRDREAVQTFTSGLAKAPDNLTLLRNRARSEVQLMADSAALADYERVVSLDSLDTESLYFHAALAVNRHEPDRALPSIRRLEALQPDSPATHKCRAAYFTTMGDPVAAIAAYDRCIALKPEAETYLGRAAVNLQLKRLDEASQDIAEAMRLDPQEGEAYYLRAALCKARLEYDAARADAAKAVALGVDPRRMSRITDDLPK